MNSYENVLLNGLECNLIKGWKMVENSGEASRKLLPRFFDSRQVKDTKTGGYGQRQAKTKTERRTTWWYYNRGRTDVRYDSGGIMWTSPPNDAEKCRILQTVWASSVEVGIWMKGGGKHRLFSCPCINDITLKKSLYSDFVCKLYV